MTYEPAMVYSISDPSHTVSELSDIWNKRLPSERDQTADTAFSVSLGDYFNAASVFLTSDDCAVIKTGARHALSAEIKARDIETINICLVKHGRFYHPSRISVDLKNKKMFSMALNVAFSTEGRQCVERECKALEALNLRVEHLPKVYGRHDVSVQNGPLLTLFCTQWFPDFHEFHLSHDKGLQKIIVWDTENGNYFLTDDEAYTVYRQASCIMTRCYNPLTCEQIQPWHHAAGDFIVNKKDGEIGVSLITARQYTSLFTNTIDDADTLIEATVIFLINLSLRMRLDREDGVGSTLWAGDHAVTATVHGFFDGLKLNDFTNPFCSSLKTSLEHALPQLNEQDIRDYCQLLVHSYNPDSPEVTTIEKHLEDHVRVLYQTFKTFCS